MGHRLGIVGIHSYTAMLKPWKDGYHSRGFIKEARKHTIDFSVVVHKGERVKVHFAMKRNVRPVNSSELTDS